jgi:hypothetical protein
MTAGQLISRGRILAERLMVDACTVKRTTGQTVGAGGVITPTTTTVYGGRCRLTQRGTGGSWADVGEQARVVSRLVLQVPVGAPEVLEGDKVTMTASALDPQLVGKVFSVRSVAHQSYPTRCEVEVIAVSS